MNILALLDTILLNKIFYDQNMKKIILVFLIAFSLLVTLYCQYPLLSNKYAINDDVRQETYVHIKYQDKDLFKGDFITDFYSRWASWGLDIVYFIISLFYDPIKFTKILPFFLCLFSTLYMFKLGKLLGNNLVGLLSGFLFVLTIWSADESIYIGTGGASNFGVFLFITFIYYFLKKDLWKTSIALVLESLFYPPVLLISFLTYAIYICYDFAKERKADKQILFHFIGSSAIIFSLSYFKYLNGHLELMGLKEIINMPEFYPGGRKVLFFPTLYGQLTNCETGFAIFSTVKYLLFLSILLGVFLKNKALDISEKLWYFLIASLILFIIATPLIYKLYGPGRFVRYTIPIFLILFTSLNTDRLLQKAKFKSIKLLTLLIFMSFTFIWIYPRMCSDYSIAPSPKLYNFLQTLPKDILIAGHPSEMDFVPVFARRKVLINEETSKPCYATFYPEIKKRTYDFFFAYYSDSPREIYDFCRKYNINYIVVYKKHFSQDYLDKGQFYLNPFNDYVRHLVSVKKRFVLMDVPQSEKIFEGDDSFIVRAESNHFWMQQ